MSTRVDVPEPAERPFARSGFAAAGACRNADPDPVDGRQALSVEIREAGSMEHPGRETRILEVQPKAGEDFQKRRTSLVAEAPDTLPRERNVVRIVLRGEGFLREFRGLCGSAPARVRPQDFPIRPDGDRLARGRSVGAD